MKIFQNALRKVTEHFPRNLLASHLRRKLTEKGVRLSQQQLEELAQRAINKDMASIDLPWWRFWQYRKFRPPKDLLIKFTPEESQKIIAALEEFLEKGIPEIIQKIINEQPEIFLSKLRKRWKSELKRQLREDQEFRRRLLIRWRAPLEQLRMLLTIAREFGSDINSELRRPGMENEKHLIDVLTRLHARACQIAAEIECLLSGGFSDGAMARWRSLHEVAVVALFISKNGRECAERYTYHQFIESRKAAKNYERCHIKLGYKPISESELEEIERLYQSVSVKYGVGFRDQYGWARPYLSIPQQALVRFSDIEEAAGIDHLRAHYQMASHNVHANPKGVFFKLGLLAESEILLAGPSNAGLADPGHATALSLMQASSALMTINPTLDNIVLLAIMMKLSDEIGDDFLAAASRLSEDETGISRGTN